jgi:hypothetical protein
MIVSRILGHNRQPAVSGYFTPTIVPEPSIERVVKISSRREAELVFICYYGHLREIRWRDCGAKVSTISIGNPMVVPTVEPLRLCLR